MNKFELTAPCHFGLEAVLKREIYDLGYEISKVEDGRVTFYGDAEAVCRANIGLRTPERILIKIAEFPAATFDELYEGIRGISWEDLIPADGRFWVKKASSIRSALRSIPDLQSVMKKAMVDRMHQAYGIRSFPETGSEYPLRVFLNKDVATVGLDTTGESLHRRGYRLLRSKAPIEETLAAALIGLTPWKPGRILADPFCGSGTFLIEAAMMAAGIAPGLHRSFLSGSWENLIPASLWKDSYEEAQEQVTPQKEVLLYGSDIDPNVIRAARQNAKRAGVEPMICWETCSAGKVSLPGTYGFLITNPPYGERLEEKKRLPDLYREIGAAFAKLPTWSEYVISAYADAERYIGKKAAKKRKIYNGMIKTDFYQFPGPRPPRQQTAG
jgi:putative N6-adenine-specific DNA methylase